MGGLPAPAVQRGLCWSPRWWSVGAVLVGLLVLVALGRLVGGQPPTGSDRLSLESGPIEPWTGLRMGESPAPVPVQPVVQRESGQAEGDRNQRISDAIARTRSSTVILEYDVGPAPLVHRFALGVVINDAGEALSIRSDFLADWNQTPVVAFDAVGHQHPARWIAADPETGLTLLKVEGDAIKPIRQAAGGPALGSEVFLIGNPFGLGMLVIRGHIAGLGRRLRIGTQTVPGLIQVQAPFHNGDIGAPLADLDGGWLGLFGGLGLAPVGQGTGRDNDLGFAIPARDALWVADRLRAAGKVDRAYLGLKLAAGPEAEPGARVTDVILGAPAHQAGLRPGDRVVGMDDRSVDMAHDLTDRLERTAAGTDLSLEYLRETQRHRVTVRTTSRPLAAVAPTRPSVAPSSGLTGNSAPPRPTPGTGRPDTRAEEATAAVIQALREQISQLEKRVEQLERANRPQKPAPNN